MRKFTTFAYNINDFKHNHQVWHNYSKNSALKYLGY